MEGYKVSIREVSKELTARERAGKMADADVKIANARKMQAIADQEAQKLKDMREESSRKAAEREVEKVETKPVSEVADSSLAKSGQDWFDWYREQDDD